MLLRAVSVCCQNISNGTVAASNTSDLRWVVAGFVESCLAIYDAQTTEPHAARISKHGGTGAELTTKQLKIT